MPARPCARQRQPVKFYSVDSWFAFWLSSKSDSKKSSTSARYKGVVDRFLAFLGKRTGENIANINAADIRNFRTQESRGGRAARTANFSVKVIRTAFNHALKLGYITVNPCHALDQLGETESKVEAFSLPQINALPTRHLKHQWHDNPSGQWRYDFRMCAGTF